MKLHACAAAKEVTLGNAESKGIADLAGSTGDNDVDYFTTAAHFYKVI